MDNTNPYSSPDDIYRESENQTEQGAADGEFISVAKKIHPAVICTAVASSIFTLGYCLSIGFGFRNYLYYSEREFHTSEIKISYAQIMLLETINQAIMAAGFAFLTLFLWKHSALLSRVKNSDSCKPADILLSQKPCWWMAVVLLAGYALLNLIHSIAMLYVQYPI